jgi:hypothetical protein
VEPQMMAEDYIEKSTKIAHTIVIIGNHDRKDNFD